VGKKRKSLSLITTNARQPRHLGRPRRLKEQDYRKVVACFTKRQKDASRATLSSYGDREKGGESASRKGALGLVKRVSACSPSKRKESPKQERGPVQKTAQSSPTDVPETARGINAFTSNVKLLEKNEAKRRRVIKKKVCPGRDPKGGVPTVTWLMRARRKAAITILKRNKKKK